MARTPAAISYKGFWLQNEVDVLAITWPGMAKKSLQSVQSAGIDWDRTYGATFNPFDVKVKVMMRGASRDPNYLAADFKQRVLYKLYSYFDARFGVETINRGPLVFGGTLPQAYGSHGPLAYDAWLIDVSALDFKGYNVIATLTFHVPVGLLCAMEESQPISGRTTVDYNYNNYGKLYGVFMPKLRLEGTIMTDDNGLFTVSTWGIINGPTQAYTDTDKVTKVSLQLAASTSYDCAIDFDAHTVEVDGSPVLPTLDSEWPRNLGGAEVTGGVPENSDFTIDFPNGSFDGTGYVQARFL